MTIDTMSLFTMFTGLRELLGTKNEAVVPEPEFKPFKFPKRADAPVRAEALSPANTTREARTLEELGVSTGLAREIETVLGVFGKTSGDRITGFTFRTPDGVSYALRTAAKAPAAGSADDLAA